MQLVDQGRIALDTPLATMLPKPLPDYADEATKDRYTDWSELDPRWRALTSAAVSRSTPARPRL